MRRRWVVVAALVVGVVGGCAPTSIAPRATPPSLIDDDDYLTWAKDEDWFVVVRKSCRTVDIYRQGVRVRSYPAVFGMNGKGSKLYEGDLRTPSGLYAIIGKRRHPRWHHFLLLDYPNLRDQQRYEEARGSGDIPRRGARIAGMGGSVGIHGTDKPRLNDLGVDWTFGCISLKNSDIGELTSLVPVGTLVWIAD